jgi:hypothetical protein
MKLSIEDVDMADVRITTMDIDAGLCTVTICSDRIFRISDNKWLDKTQIIIRDWTELHVEKYVSQSPFIKGQTFLIDWTKQAETFELIQEIKCSDKDILSLSGFSKQSGAWLTYTFTHYNCDITATEINKGDATDIHSSSL